MLTILQKRVKQGSMDGPGVLERQKDVRRFFFTLFVSLWVASLCSLPGY